MVSPEAEDKLVTFLGRYICPLLASSGGMPLCRHNTDRSDRATLLHLAASSGLPRCARLLLDLGADVNAISRSLTKMGEWQNVRDLQTPLDVAIERRKRVEENKSPAGTYFQPFR